MRKYGDRIEKRIPRRRRIRRLLRLTSRCAMTEKMFVFRDDNELSTLLS
jgi:hypothetical protein